MVLIGIAQGLTVSILLFKKTSSGSQNTILGLLLIGFILVSFKILLHTLDLWDSFLAYFPLAIDLSIPPLIYIYTLSLTVYGFRLRRKHLLHFIPFIVFQVYSVVVYIKVLGLIELSNKDLLVDVLLYDSIKQIEDYLMLISVVCYIYLSITKLATYRDWLNSEISNASFTGYSWLRKFLVASIILAALLTLNFVLDWFFDFNENRFIHWKIFYILLSINIYYLGITGYRQPRLRISGYPTQDIDNRRVKKMDKEKSNEIVQLLGATLTKERIYRDPDLTLSKLARNLNVDKGRLSYVINQNFAKNFRELINDHRIEEVINRLQNEELGTISLAGLAYECGFNSESTFYRVFKKKMGMSPKEYLSVVKK